MRKLHGRQNVDSQYSILNNIIFLLRAIASHRPFLFLLIIIEIVTSIVSPVIAIYLPSYAVELVTGKTDATVILFKLGGLGALLAVFQGLRNMASEGKYMLYNGMRNYFQLKIFYKSLHCDYAYVESKEGMTKYQRALDTLFGGDASGTSRMLVSAMGFIIDVLTYIIYFGILAGLHPAVVILLTVMSVLNLVLYRYAQDYEHSQKDKKAYLCQKLDYVEFTAKDVTYAKDVRLYRLSDWFLGNREKLSEAYGKLQNQTRNRYFAVACIGTFTRILQSTFAYGYLIYCVLNGQIDVDEFVLYFGAITGFSGFVEGISSHFNTLRSSNLQMNDMRRYLDLTDGTDAKREYLVKLPDEKQLSIEFDHVWFGYEKDENFVLQDFCLYINAGEKLALVGINGVGKTTLIKLLCGFYQPDRGVIRIGGVDIRNYRKEDLYMLFSAVFQDLYIDPFTVAENVSMSLAAETDMERVEECLARTGLLEVIRTYPEHINAYMGKTVNDGIVLSGGQNQKLLMARALYKEAPIMILDEPTAALDPIAESETYENFHRLTGGKTVIYISHRLASTRFCDRIVFLKDGQNAESGTHEELIQLGGNYAEMFEVQSHYYKKGGEDSENSENKAELE